MLKKALSGIIFICIILLFYYAWFINYIFIQNMQLALLVSLIVYHLAVEKKRTNVLIVVFTCFVLNAFLLVIFNYTHQENSNYILLSNFLGLLGFIVVLVSLIKSKKFRLSIFKHLTLIIVTLIIDCVIIYYYLKSMSSLNIYVMHTEFSIFYPVIELILISIILFYYISNRNLKSSLLVISICCFFLSEVAQICQFLFFISKKLKALAILDVGFYVFGIYLLYKYFTNNENKLAKLY